MKKLKKCIIVFYLLILFLVPQPKISAISEKFVLPIYVGSFVATTVIGGEVLNGCLNSNERIPAYIFSSLAGAIISFIPAFIADKSTPRKKFMEKFLEYDAKVKVAYLLSEELLYQMPTPQKVRLIANQLYVDSDYGLVEACAELKLIIKEFSILKKYFEILKADIQKQDKDTRAFEIYIRKIIQRATKRVREITKDDTDASKNNAEYSKQLELYQLQKAEKQNSKKESHSSKIDSEE